MRTKVVSWESAAVTELFGVLHVPQLYSLFEKRSGKWVPVSRGRRRCGKLFIRQRGKKLSSDLIFVPVVASRADRDREGTHPCLVAASTMAATVMPLAPDAARRT